MRQITNINGATSQAELFLTSKVRLHCDPVMSSASPAWEVLFLTSKVRLHCDSERHRGCWRTPYPLFLTSKVRLHCDEDGIRSHEQLLGLFLTSKVRLHCDTDRLHVEAWGSSAFPDLKGQAPLRLHDVIPLQDALNKLFLTSKVRLHCDA